MYDVGESRRVRRLGFDLELYPRSYFQWARLFGLPDPDLDAFRAAADGASVVVDIGANVGVYAMCIARENPSSRVFAIEPNRSARRILERHLRANAVDNVESIPLAMGDEIGELELYRAESGDHGKASARPREIHGESYSVEMTTVDAFVRDRGIDEFGAMKFDVEGLEPQMLEGARAVIECDAPALLVEFNADWYGPNGPAAEAILTFLAECGYRYWGTRAYRSRTNAGKDLRKLLEESGQSNLVLESTK